ncbi:MAG: Asp-tRNA(Asn)/Glu-tRNA(Gln) amidotransferase subunit GatA [Ignavibacteriaceae bacterium]
MELCNYSALELVKKLRKKEISAKEIVTSVLNRIGEKEHIYNAFITVTDELALKQAELADENLSKGEDISPLTGIPVAIKDNICTKGILTTCGSKILDSYKPPYNATAVQNLINDGALIIGKTNLDEFGMGSSTEKSYFGPTHNPHNPDYVPGGSSGGSATAVSLCESVLAIGTDTGGSVRMPAAYCGVVGAKPTYGRVSRYGVVSYASSLDQIGGFGRTVEDTALLLDSICGYDENDSTSAKIPNPNFSQSLKPDLNNIKIGLPKEYFVEGIDERIKEKILKAVELLEENGAELHEISLPHTKYAISTYYLIAMAEASSNLARYDGVRFGYRAKENVSDLNTMYEKTRTEGFGREVIRRIMLGSYVLSAGYYDAYYLKAQQVRALIRQDLENAFEKIDCIITPVTPTLPYKIGEKNEDPLQMYLEDIFTVSLNLAGLPGISLNCGYVNEFPVGFQIIGKAFEERTILSTARSYEQLNSNNR